MLEIENASNIQKNKFRETANKLLNQCFVLKKKPETKKDYYFIKENKHDFDEYFDLLGYRILIDEENGVIGLDNIYKTGRLSFSKIESVLLLILRLMYLEQRKDISTFSEDVIVSMDDINQKYRMLEIKSKPVLDKNMENNFVSLFRRYNLIKNLDTDVNQADARIQIYPSILMAVRNEDINQQYIEMQKEKLNAYAGVNDDGNSDSEEDTETDSPD